MTEYSDAMFEWMFRVVEAEVLTDQDKENFRVALKEQPALVNGADVNREGWTLLLEAVRLFRLEVLAMLIEAGADINQGDFNGWTPLMEAVLSQNIDVLRFLVTLYDLDINKADPKYNVTPLMLAVMNNSFGVVEFLIARGANVNIADSAHVTPLYLALNREDADAMVIKALKEAQALEYVPGREFLPLEYYTKK